MAISLLCFHTDKRAFQGDWCPSRCQIHRPNLYDPGMSCKCFRCHPLHCSWAECCKNLVLVLLSLNAFISLNIISERKKRTFRIANHFGKGWFSTVIGVSVDHIVHPFSSLIENHCQLNMNSALIGLL